MPQVEELDYDVELEERPTIKGDLEESLGLVESDALSKFGIEKENYTLTYDQNVKISKIVISEPIKKGRKMTIRGLTKSIGELGVVTPIHVMRLESADAIDDEDEDFPEFQLIKGARRLFGAIKNNLDTIPCIIWDFKDKDKGRQAALILGLTLGRTQKRSWSEIWDLLNVLELQSQIKPTTFESLFQLNPGDTMKIKDVMFSDYTDLKDELLANEKSLEQVYKQLQRLRKEEDSLEIEDRTGFSDTSDLAKEVVDGVEEVSATLSNEEVEEILELGSAFGKDLAHSDFSELEGEFKELNYQTSKNRRPLDPALRQRILTRDEYTCMCCSMHGPAFVGALVVHHIIPVHCYGESPSSNPDAEENMVTVCDSCHLIIHIIERDGKLPITEDQFNQYSYEDKLRIRNIMHYARIAIVAGKRKGLTDEQRRKLAKESIKHRFPGDGYKENRTGYALFEQQISEIEKIKNVD